jgi:hypothetical protein
MRVDPIFKWFGLIGLQVAFGQSFLDIMRDGFESSIHFYYLKYYLIKTGLFLLCPAQIYKVAEK